MILLPRISTILKARYHSTRFVKTSTLGGVHVLRDSRLDRFFEQKNQKQKNTTRPFLKRRTEASFNRRMAYLYTISLKLKERASRTTQTILSTWPQPPESASLFLWSLTWYLQSGAWVCGVFQKIGQNGRPGGRETPRSNSFVFVSLSWSLAFFWTCFLLLSKRPSQRTGTPPDH